jgi:hypothetical protein
MPQLFELARECNPIAALPHFDRLRVWPHPPLTNRQLASLDRECIGGVRPDNEPAWFNRRYRQKIDLFQPSPTALQLLGEFDEGVSLVNYAEIACNLIFSNELATARVVDDFEVGFLQPHHGKMRAEIYPQGFSTRRTPERGQRRAGRWFVFYGDRPCKLTDAPHCFHFEGRHEGADAVRRIGINRAQDLGSFDFDAYFTQRMVLHALDVERLGRYDANKSSHSRRRHAHVEGFGLVKYNFDRRRGGALYHVLSVHEDQSERSLQQFVDRYGRGPFLTPVHYYVHVRERLLMPETRTNPALLANLTPPSHPSVD